jgi:hypothetical protein
MNHVQVKMADVLVEVVTIRLHICLRFKIVGGFSRTCGSR